MKSFSKTLVYHLIFELTKTVKKLEYRDLTDPKKLKLFQNINTCSLLPGCINSKNIEHIWKEFMDIIGDLKPDFTLE